MKSVLLQCVSCNLQSWNPTSFRLKNELALYEAQELPEVHLKRVRVSVAKGSVATND